MQVKSCSSFTAGLLLAGHRRGLLSPAGAAVEACRAGFSLAELLTSSPDLTSVLRSARRQAHEQGGSQEMSIHRHRAFHVLPAEPRASPGQAGPRASPSGTLRMGLGEHAELAELIVGELAANAIQHGDGPVRVRVSYARGDLRVDVHDDGAGQPVRRPVTADDESGRGLALLDDLIGQCGGPRAVADDGAGHAKTVSVTVRLAAGPGCPVTDASTRTARRIHAGTPPGTGGRLPLGRLAPAGGR